MTLKLTCGQCSFENEAERVYCHNCGAKLDRSLVPTGKEKGEKRETPEKARRRIQRMTNPGGGGLWREVKALVSTLFWAVIAAGVILMMRPPVDAPPVKNELPTRLIQSEMMETMESPAPRAISFSEDDINLHFKQTLKASEGAVPGVRFERAYVHLLPGVLHICTAQSVFGFSIFSGIDYQLAVVGGKFTPTVVGGNFGRLKMPAPVMRYVGEYAFKQLWTALKRERAQMDRMQSVMVTKGQITLVTKGAAVK